MTRISFSEEELLEVFVYLDKLRNSGRTNMMGARGYIIREFGWDGEKSAKALTTWMKTYGNKGGMDGRVESALHLIAHEVS